MKTKLGYFSLFILFILPVQLHSEWSIVKNLYQGLNLNSISIINPGNIFIACDSASILKSTEAGVTWTRSSNIAGFSSNIKLKTIFFIDSANGYAAGTAGYAARTTNNGQSWAPMTLADQGTTVNQIIFADSNFGWAVGNSGKVQHTQDGGTNWSIQYTFTGVISINSIFILPGDTSKIWVCGNSGFIAGSTDGGYTWVSPGTLTTSDLLSVKFVDNIIWAVGKSGTMLLSINFGASWTQISSPVSININSIIISNEGSAKITTANGEILETCNYGNNWDMIGASLSSPANQIAYYQPWIFTTCDGGNLGMVYITDYRAKLCFDAYNLCLIKCSKDNNSCLNNCNDMYNNCLKNSKFNAIDFY